MNPCETSVYRCFLRFCWLVWFNSISLLWFGPRKPQPWRVTAIESKVPREPLFSLSHAPYRINAGGAKAHLHGNLGMPSGQPKRTTRDGPIWLPEVWKTCCDPRCHESKSVGGQELHLQKRDPWSLALLQPLVVFSLMVSFRISCLLYTFITVFAKRFLIISYLACLLSFNSLLILLILVTMPYWLDSEKDQNSRSKWKIENPLQDVLHGFRPCTRWSRAKRCPNISTHCERTQCILCHLISRASCIRMPPKQCPSRRTPKNFQ